MSVGSAGLPPPTTVGQTNNWHSSTSPALKACAAQVRTSYGEIAAGRSLQFVYRGGVEVAFEPGVGG